MDIAPRVRSNRALQAAIPMAQVHSSPHVSAFDHMWFTTAPVIDQHMDNLDVSQTAHSKRTMLQASVPAACDQPRIHLRKQRRGRAACYNIFAKTPAIRQLWQIAAAGSQTRQASGIRCRQMA